MNQLLKERPEIVLTMHFTLMGMAIIWLVLVAWSFRRLRTRHPATYQAMGSPSLFWNNSMRSAWLFFRFLWSGRSAQLGDPAICRISQFMRFHFIAFILLFLAEMTLPLTASLFLKP